MSRKVSLEGWDLLDEELIGGKHTNSAILIEDDGSWGALTRCPAAGWLAGAVPLGFGEGGVKARLVEVEAGGPWDVLTRCPTARLLAVVVRLRFGGGGVKVRRVKPEVEPPGRVEDMVEDGTEFFDGAIGYSL